VGGEDLSNFLLVSGSQGVSPGASVEAMGQCYHSPISDMAITECRRGYLDGCSDYWTTVQVQGSQAMTSVGSSPRVPRQASVACRAYRFNLDTRSALPYCKVSMYFVPSTCEVRYEYHGQCWSSKPSGSLSRYMEL
jgi:hypothetical protein